VQFVNFKVQDTLDNFTSKWDAPETIDVERKVSNADSHDSSNSKQERSDKNGSDTIKLITNDAHEEEKRRLLREIELKVVEYQDELEADGAAHGRDGK
jgi:hypothetical protein